MIPAMAPDQNPTPDLLLDARRLLCPLPILRAEVAIGGLPSGAILAVQSTDPGFSQDFSAWCAINGHRLLNIQNQGREWIGWVVKG